MVATCSLPVSIAILVFLCVNLSLCWAQAPGDEDARCTTEHDNPPQYPDTVRPLMDSYHYTNLLPGNGTGNTIIADTAWNDFSFDMNDVDGVTATSTYWQQGAGGTCRYQVRVCGWRREGTAQNNWLFTQHISQDFDPNDYPSTTVKIKVEIILGVMNCRGDCKTRLNLLHYMTNETQLPSSEGSGFMNTDNYERFASPQAPPSPQTTDRTPSFTLPPSSTGFYLAAQDTGSCLAISRMRVYRSNCKPREIGLVSYPEVPAPASGSVSINITCGRHAESERPEVTCYSSGTWGSEDPVCECCCGYVESSVSVCTACPADEYRSKNDTSCQECPANTVRTKEAACICECLNGYFRNNESYTDSCGKDHPTEIASDGCTRPPSPPENLTVVAVSPTEIQVTWSPPTDDGERTDLYYRLDLSSMDPTCLDKDSTNHSFSGLKPFTEYHIKVTAHNGVSDQDPDRTHLRTVEESIVTPEDEPGPPEGVEGHCSVVVWKEPAEPNGLIFNYILLFYLNVGNDSGVVLETGSDKTHFVIQSPYQLPLNLEGGNLFVKVLAQNGAGMSKYSLPAYVGCEDPPGDLRNVSTPFFPPMVPEPVTAEVMLEGGLIVWERPRGRVSYYLVTVSDESGQKLKEEETNEQFVTLPDGAAGTLVVEICTVLDGVRGNCTSQQLSVDSSCPSEEGGVSQLLLIITACACCGGTALLVVACCLVAAGLHHWRFRRQFGPNKEALTWEAYEMKT